MPPPKSAAAKKLALVNIWDDYWEDDDLPKGEKQETRIILENYEPEIPAAEAKKILQFLIQELKNIKLTPKPQYTLAKYASGYPKIKVVNLTHAARERLLTTLQKKRGLTFEGWKFSFCSES